jgi:peptidoglycan/xylan/chitin deacetylase (PgdA/CDA1 family)
MLNRLIKLTISTFFFVFSKIIGLIKLPFSKKLPNTLVVVSYHSVKPHQRHKFAKQMDQVIKVGKPVFADMGESSNKRIHHIAVTFDDGFQNFMDNALPEMLIRKIPATLFITTVYLGKIPGWIKNPNHENAQEILMTADQLKALPDEMVRIGSHCVTHPRLTSLNKEQIISELSESKKYLESLLEKNITILAFPYDDYNEEIVELARKAGYLHVFKDLPTCPISKTDSFLLGRISVSPEDWGSEYLLKLKGAYQWLPFAVEIKRFLFEKDRFLRKVDYL